MTGQAGHECIVESNRAALGVVTENLGRLTPCRS